MTAGRRAQRVAVVAVLLLGCATGRAPAEDPTASRITVAFTHAEHFTDLKDRCLESERVTAALLGELEAFVRRTAASRLPAGGALAVTVTDVDMAGEFESWRGPQFCQVRTLRDAYPPRIRLTFQLRDADGRITRSGERDLIDATYLMRVGLDPHDHLRYEKELLRQWIQRELTH